jgi:hypothetical protein
LLNTESRVQHNVVHSVFVARSHAGEDYQRARRQNLNFAEMGIPVGSDLLSTVNDTKVTVISPKKVQLDGQEISLTAATRVVFGLGYSVAPASYGTFNGKQINQIYEET